MGIKAGAPDICMFVPSRFNNNHYHGLLIELKRPEDKNIKAGVLSDAQCSMIARLRDNGYFVSVSYGWDEAMKVTKMYLGD